LIPTNFEIIGLKQHANGQSKDAAVAKRNPDPVRLQHDLLDVWYSQDTVFKMPRVIIQLIFFSPCFSDHPLKRVSNAVFIDAFMEKVSEEVGYLANMADVVYSVKTYENNGLKFKVKGYNHKLQIFLKKFITILNQLHTHGFEPAHHISVQNSIEKKLKEYINLNLEIDKHTNNNRLLLLMEKQYHADVLANELKVNSKQIFKDICSGAYLRTIIPETKYTRLVVHGNCNQEIVRSYADIVASELNLTAANQDEAFASQIALKIATLPTDQVIRWDVCHHHKSKDEQQDDEGAPSDEQMSEQGEDEQQDMEDIEDEEGEEEDNENNNHIQMYF
jgi:secreted Zn-dependent insulinase-like peptidase